MHFVSIVYVHVGCNAYHLCFHIKSICLDETWYVVLSANCGLPFPSNLLVVLSIKMVGFSSIPHSQVQICWTCKNDRGFLNLKRKKKVYGIEDESQLHKNIFSTAFGIGLLFSSSYLCNIQSHFGYLSLNLILMCMDHEDMWYRCWDSSENSAESEKEFIYIIIPVFLCCFIDFYSCQQLYKCNWIWWICLREFD